MPKVKIEAEVSERCYHEYEIEAQRQGVPVETLVQRTVNLLLKDKECEEDSDPIYLP